MKSKPIKFSAGNRRIFKCRGCQYFRDVTQDKMLLSLLLAHPVYGKVTIGEAAYLDTINHRCESYKEAVRKVRNLPDGSAILASNDSYYKEMAGKENTASKSLLG